MGKIERTAPPAGEKRWTLSGGEKREKRLIIVVYTSSRTESWLADP